MSFVTRPCSCARAWVIAANGRPAHAPGGCDGVGADLTDGICLWCLEVCQPKDGPRLRPDEPTPRDGTRALGGVVEGGR